MAAYPTKDLCIADSVRSGTAPRKRATPDVISVIHFLASTLKIFPCPWARRLYYDLFPIGERWGLQDGFKMNKTVMCVLNVAIKFFVVSQDAISVK